MSRKVFPELSFLALSFALSPCSQFARVLAHVCTRERNRCFRTWYWSLKVRENSRCLELARDVFCCFFFSSSEREFECVVVRSVESNAQINVRCVTCEFKLPRARRGTEPETRRFDAACPRVTRLTTAGPWPLKSTTVGAQLLLCRRRRRRRPTREAANCHAGGG